MNRLARLSSLALLVFVAVVPSACEDDGGTKKRRAGINEPCASQEECVEGVCALPAGGEGTCKQRCEQAGSTCSDGTLCFESRTLEGDPVNVCSTFGCTDRDCGANSTCDVATLSCICFDGFRDSGDGRSSSASASREPP